MAESAGAVARPGALRLVSASVEASLERFGDAQILAEGKVNIISLEAVEQRFGPRWALRRDQVYDFATRVLERGVGDQGFHQRISATDFFIVHPDLSRLAGQAACLRYLREILNHFLGDVQMAASGVLQVNKITKGALEASQVDARAAEAATVAAEATEALTASKPAAAADDDQDAPSVNRWTPFVATDGRELRVTATLEPVYELKGFTRIGFRMIRRVIVVASNEELSLPQVAMLSAGDRLRIDLATITRGIDRLRADGAGQQLSLIVPLSFASLSSQRGRAELITPLKAAGALVRLGVICEICDIEGVPQGALLAAASLVRPFSLLVVGRLEQPTPNVIARLDGAGLQALSFECPRGLGDAEFVGWATSAIAAAKRRAKAVMVYRASSTQRAGDARPR